MIFQHTHELVMSGEKSQTRRLVKPGQEISAAHTCIYAFHPYRIIYEVGRTYAVQTARTAKAIARIRITAIRCEDVREISREDVEAEGFDSAKSFFDTWTLMHDKPAHKVYSAGDCIPGCRDYLRTRPAERYAAWALTFELVGE